MSKIQKVIIGLGIAGAVGITYMFTTLKDMPDIFNWEEDDE